MNPDDLLKSLTTVSIVDPRTQGTMSSFDPVVGHQSEYTLAEHHEAISTLQLTDSVPEHIVVNFEVARNLYLYSFFVYRFGVVACTQALQTLEYALRERTILEGVTIKQAGLSSLLRYAVKNGWLSDRAFTDIGLERGRPRNAYSKRLSKILPGLRNDLAHGTFTLFPPHEALKQLRICASIINHMYGR